MTTTPPSDPAGHAAPAGAGGLPGPSSASPPAPVPGPDDEALARLRAADPAASAHPDAHALRAAVAARADAAPAAGRDELAARRAGRWTQWPVRMAGVAAAALLIGGGGGYAIAAAGDGGGAGSSAPAGDVISLESGSGASSPDMGGGGGAEMMPAPESSGGRDQATADSASSWAGWGRTVFTQSGLPTEGGTARAWGFDPAAAFTPETLARMAAALGVEGEVVEQDGMLSVGSTDGTGPGATLYPDGMVSFNYFDPSKDPWSCGDAAAREAGTAESGDIVPCDLGPAPSGDAAAAPLRDAMTAAGLDPAGFELVEEEWSEEGWTYVTAYRVIDGQRTGDTWSATLTGAGLQSLYGGIAPVVELGEYAVVSPAEAVERLTDPRFGGSGGGPIAFVDGQEPAVDMPAPPVAELPAAPEPGAALSWPVEEVTIVDFRLGVALHMEPGGATLLVPTYELISDDGAIWSVVAVTEDHLDTAPLR